MLGAGGPKLFKKSKPFYEIDAIVRSYGKESAAGADYDRRLKIYLWWRFFDVFSIGTTTPSNSWEAKDREEAHAIITCTGPAGVDGFRLHRPANAHTGSVHPGHGDAHDDRCVHVHV